jgi:lipopolysaccharide transport system ATP-binding protein
MSEIAIRVEDLGKRYRIGGPKEAYGTLRDSLVSLAKVPLRAVQRGSANGHREFWALRDVSFEVKRGEVLGVIGRNGAGKSTLLKILSQITEPTTGYAEIRGRVGSLLEVGTGFHPELTGRENIYLNGAILGMKKAEIDRAFDEIVEFAEIEQFLDTPDKRYSSGMYMRLAFSIAAHLEPEILIVDEVLAVGDGAFQKKCLGKMGDVANEGRTVLFVSHNLAAVESLCRRAVVLSAGNVVCDQAPGIAIARYFALSQSPGGGQAEITTDHRDGTGRVRFHSLAFFDGSTGERLQQIRTGQTIRFRLGYRVADPSCMGKPLKVGLGFQDEFDHLKFAVNNEAVGFPLVVSEHGYVEVVVPRFPLSDGLYYCYIYSEVSGTKADFVPRAAPVDVLRGDYYGTGKLPAEGKRGLCVPYDWIG